MAAKRTSISRDARSGLATAELAARLQAIFNTVVDGIVIMDEQSRIDAFNPAAERIFGHRAQDVIGRKVTMLMPPPWNQHHDTYVQRYLKTGKARIIGIGREVRGLRKDGTTFPMDLAVSEVRVGKRRLFTGIVRDITDRKRAEQAIAQASEEERRRLGQDLHDGLGQQLTGVTLLTKALQGRLARDRHPAQADAAELAGLLARVLSDMRRQAHGLYPVELEQRGLTAALEELALGQRQLYGIDCRFALVGRLPALDKSTALHLYRIVQEAVHNAVRHGQAKRICIRMDRSANVLHLEVEDDGTGIRLRKNMPGMGLNIMRFRADAVGGQLEIGRAHPRGTRVRLVMPLHAASGRRA